MWLFTRCRYFSALLFFRAVKKLFRSRRSHELGPKHPCYICLPSFLAPPPKNSTRQTFQLFKAFGFGESLESNWPSAEMKSSNIAISKTYRKNTTRN